MEGYIQKIATQDLEENKIYSQVVIKQSKNDPQNPDKTIFEFHSTKGSNNIYINTALLSCLNQFDYYLRYELRSHRSS